MFRLEILSFVDLTSLLVMPANATALPPEVEAKLERLNEGKRTWQELGVPGRLKCLQRLRKRAKTIDFLAWATESSKVQGFDPSAGVARAQILAETMIIAANIGSEITRLIESLSAVVSSGTPPTCVSKQMPQGHTASVAFPRTWRDKYLNPLGALGWTAEVWTKGEPTQGRTLCDPLSSPKLCLVLGAGNQEFLTVVDVMDKLFVHGEAVLLKHHPLREHQLAFLETLFADVMEYGAFASITGGGDLGRLLAHHPHVDGLHLTGGGSTYDALVWGLPSDPETATRKASKQPLLPKPFSSELGCVTPWILVPDDAWTTADLEHHAWQLANSVVANASCNCLSPKALLLPKEWAQTERFVTSLKEALRQIHAPPPYYPGLHERFARFEQAYPTAEKIEAPHSSAIAADAASRFGAPTGFLLIELDSAKCAADEYALTREAFAPVLAIVRLEGTAEPEAFLRHAVPFANERIFGNLSVTVLLHPQTEKDHQPAVLDALAGLRYGCVGVNTWTGLAYGMECASWGGFAEDNSPENIKSGVGVVRNCLLFDNISKSVVRSPFRSSVHLTQRNATTSSIGPRTLRFVGGWVPKMLI